MQLHNQAIGTLYQPPTYTIKQMLITPTKRYQPLYNRAYTLDANYNTVGKLQSVINPDSNVSTPKAVSDATVAQFIPEIISLNPAASKASHIPNGWETERFRFIMEVEIGVAGQTYIHYYQGYSEFLDMSYNGNIDEHMRFFINSVSITHKQYNPITGLPMYTGTQNFQLLRSESGLNMVELDTLDTTLIRPVDILKSIDLENTHGNGNGLHIINKTADLRNDISLRNSKANNNPYTYFTNIINSVSKAAVGAHNLGPDTALQPGPRDIYKAAHEELSLSSLNNYRDTFLIYLGQQTNRRIAEDFTLADLQRIMPTVANVITLVTDTGHNSNFNFINSEYTSGTLQPTPENIKAIHIANTIPSLMGRFLLTKCQFTYNNETGEDVIYVTADSIFQDINLLENLDRLENKILTTVIPMLKDHGQSIVRASVSSDSLGDTDISISVNGQPDIIYRFPTFADGLYAPVITNTIQSQAVKNDFRNVLETCYNTSGFDDIDQTVNITNSLNY